jgi:hypothetical protein
MKVATTATKTWPRHGQKLRVVALRKASLSCIWFYLDDNMVQAIQLEYVLRL